MVDVRIIDGAVNGVGFGIGAVSQRLRHVQTGLVTNYALAIALGMVVMVGIYLSQRCAERRCLAVSEGDSKGREWRTFRFSAR